MSILEKELDWKNLSQALAAGAGLEQWCPEVRSWLAGKSVDRVLVACSGGADSVFLLCQLWAFRLELDFELVVGHYNHGWRGEASKADAAFVKALAQGLELAFLTETRPAEIKGATETQARALRLKFLRTAAEDSGCKAICFGHQQNDILETQLQRLARGAGVEGLAAPRPVHIFVGDVPVHLRPLLGLRAGSLRQQLKRVGIPWCEDATNADTKIARNSLRNKIIPELEAILGRDVSGGAARARRLLEADALALAKLAREALPEAYQGKASLNRDSLRDLPEALSRRALTAWLEGCGLLGSLSATGLDGLLAALRGESVTGRQSAGASFVVFDREQIWHEAESKPAASLQAGKLVAGNALSLSTGAVLESEWVPVDEKLLARLEQGKVNPTAACFAVLPPETKFIEVRELKSGDRYQALGAPGSRKLKDCLMDRGLCEKERKLLPVVSLPEGSIIWVPGLPVSDSCRVGSNAKKALRLTYRTGEAL
ncbi:MAG: tRNA(Ile)-lysidine synthase [Opitutia bacterium UBA7350]|nr:MAG: tRNA(Ile)-lysidine synthase [Opitutae bacterium UBA7350]